MSLDYYELIPTKRGRNLIMYKGYTFSWNTGKYWCSSRQSYNCKSWLKLDRNMRISLKKIEHRHKKPNYLKTNKGTYVKLF